MPDLSATEYPTFFQNLSQRVQAKEVSSLHVLGEDFFSLVDTFSQQLFDEYKRDTQSDIARLESDLKSETSRRKSDDRKINTTITLSCV